MNKAKEEKEKSEQDPAEEQEVQPYTEPQEETDDNEDDTDEFQVDQEEQEKYKRVRFFSCVGIAAAVITLVAVIGYFSVTNIMSIYFKIDENIYKDDYKQEAYQEHFIRLLLQPVRARKFLFFRITFTMRMQWAG